MRQFRLRGENVVIHLHSIFFFPHREICPKKEEQVEFHGHILLTEILGRIFKFLFFKKLLFCAGLRWRWLSIGEVFNPREGAVPVWLR